MKIREIDYELNWTWWTIGVRYRNEPFDGVEWIIGIGPFMLIIHAGYRE